MKYVHGLRVAGAILGIFLLGFPSPLWAQNLTQGQIQALAVTGDAKVSHGGKDTPIALKRDDYIQVGDVVMAGKDGVALLAFANGAMIRIKPNSQMSVTKFQQKNFDAIAAGRLVTWTKEPSQSVTELDCRNGTVDIRVKTLNVTVGSKFSVNTPAGPFGASDGFFSVSVVRDATGRVQKLLGNCYLGAITCSPTVALGNRPPTPASNKIDIPAGGQVQFHLLANAEVGAGATLGSGAAAPSANNPQASGTEMNQVFGAGLPQNNSQYAITSFYAAMNIGVSSAFAPAAEPPAPSPAPPPGLALANFDPNMPPPVVSGIAHTATP